MAGAAVVRSLFEEQILAEANALDEALELGADVNPEGLSYLPQMQHAGAEAYLRHLEQLRATDDLPLIGSINAVNPGAWTSYARNIASTGVDAIELNVYAVPTDLTKSGAQIEDELYDIISGVVESVDIPISLKMSPYYTSILHVANQAVNRGIKGLVYFNRFLQPTIDVEREVAVSDLPFTTESDQRLPLRYTALSYGRIDADIAVTGGVETGEDIAKMLLAGATITQVASVLMKRGVAHVRTILDELESWMNERGYYQLDDFRGKLASMNRPGLDTYERAQYVSLLLSEDLANATPY